VALDSASSSEEARFLREIGNSFFSVEWVLIDMCGFGTSRVNAPTMTNPVQFRYRSEDQRD
jgi:hypothetical protein